jgi:hypothetical protein
VTSQRFLCRLKRFGLRVELQKIRMTAWFDAVELAKPLRGCRMNRSLASICMVLAAACTLAQQDTTAPVEPMDQTPLFRVKVVSRTTKAVNYRHRGGSTTVDLKGTSLMPEATGRAKVDSKAGRLEINVEISRLQPATKLGPEYLTYVLWAITPEGRSVNLGEIVPNNNGKTSLDVTSQLQAFGLIITAEPYYSVIRPSDKVVVENVIRQETKGLEQPIDAKFDMLEAGQYTVDMPTTQLPSATADPKTPLDLLEARNAVAIAKAAGAAQYAPDTLKKAEDLLAQAEGYLRRKQGKTPIGTVARGATQTAEDARVLTLRKKEQERIAAEKRAMQESQAKAEAEAKASAEAEAQAKAQAEEVLVKLLGSSQPQDGRRLEDASIQLGWQNVLASPGPKKPEDPRTRNPAKE